MLGLDVLDCFGEKLKFLLQKEDWEGINEIRVRTGRAVILKKGAEEFFIGPGGLRTKDIASAYRADRAEGRAVWAYTRRAFRSNGRLYSLPAAAPSQK